MSSSSLPSFSNPLDKPLDFLKEVAIAPLVLPTMGAAAVGMEGFKTVGTMTGLMESPEQKAAREAEEARVAEDTARAGAYNDALNDAGLDSISRNEIVQMFRGGASSQNIASYLQAARSGKGVFGVRSINEAQAKAQANNPGRASTLGSGSII